MQCGRPINLQLAWGDVTMSSREQVDASTTSHVILPKTSQASDLMALVRPIIFCVIVYVHAACSPYYRKHIHTLNRVRDGLQDFFITDKVVHLFDSSTSASGTGVILERFTMSGDFLVKKLKHT